MSSENCTHPCRKDPKQNTECFYHSRKFTLGLSGTIMPEKNNFDFNQQYFFSIYAVRILCAILCLLLLNLNFCVFFLFLDIKISLYTSGISSLCIAEPVFCYKYYYNVVAYSQETRYLNT